MQLGKPAAVSLHRQEPGNYKTSTDIVIKGDKN
jgi:hypothetical protein